METNRQTVRQIGNDRKKQRIPQSGREGERGKEKKRKKDRERERERWERV